MKTKFNDAMTILRQGNIGCADMIINDNTSVKDKLSLAIGMMETCLSENRQDAAEHYRVLIESIKKTVHPA
jgi:hypothetical protein